MDVDEGAVVLVLVGRAFEELFPVLLKESLPKNVVHVLSLVGQLP